MIGSHTILSNICNEITDEELEFLKHEKWFEVETKYQDNKLHLIRSYYNGYPFDYWENEKRYPNKMKVEE